ncbi:MAG: GerW family sporulation protein [Lachnospiraceae bacterium]|nr:GerW family sporulation protein [Lachnospiraceae bacterium]
MDNNFSGTVGSLLKGLEGFISTKTVVGDAVKFDDGTIILPLVDVSFGVGAGSSMSQPKKENAFGGMGGKVQPSAILVIKNGEIKLVNVKNQSGFVKVMDMIPDFVDKFKGAKEEGKTDDTVED